MNEEQLKQHQEMYAWFKERQVQQIAYPLDDASKNSLGVITSDGEGSAPLTQNINIGGTPTVISVPANYQGTVIIEAEGRGYQVPFLDIV